MSSTSEPIGLTDKPPTNRAVVTAITPNRVHRPQTAFTTLAATITQTAHRAIVGGLLIAALLTAAISLAAPATAKGQEGGVVCTGTQMASNTCQPKASQATPIGSIPLGCKPSSNDTVACGRRGYHVDTAPPAQSAGSAANGPTQAPATRSGITTGAQPQQNRHAPR